MNRRAIQFFLVAFLLTSSCSFFEPPFSIKGTISNFDEFQTKDAKIQLVPLDSQKAFRVKEVRAGRDLGGNLVSIEYSSDFPIQSASKDFNYKLNDIKPGLYVLSIHTLRPKLSSGGEYRGPTLGRPLSASDGQVIVVEISENAKLPISIHLEKVLIPSSDKIIIAEFINVKKLKY